MNKIFLIGLLAAVCGCTLQTEQVLRASETAIDVSVPGQVMIEPLSVPVSPDSTGDMVIHVFGIATNTDAVNATSLAVEVGRDTSAPDFDTAQFFQFRPGESKNFDLEFQYTLPLGFQFNEVVLLGSGSNQIEINSITINVEEATYTQ